MTLTCTFIPSQRAKDLLCALYAEYGCAGNTSHILLDLRDELGPEEHRRFEHDLVTLMTWMPAARAMRVIIKAAIVRDRSHYQSLKITRLRGVFEPPPGQRTTISNRFD